MCDIIYGGKPLNLPGIERLLYAHDTVFRINLNTHNLDETMCMKDVYYLNSHVYDYYTNPNITVEQLLDIYKHKGTQRKYIENMLEIIRNGKFKNIKKQPFSGNLEANRLLSYIRCPVQFHGQPRCGYQCLLENLNRKNFVIGFGLDDDDISFYNNPDKSVILTACHSVESEKQVLRWMHETGTIDASYCLLTDNTIPQLDCKLLKPTADSITNLLKIYGICVLDNYFSSEIIDKFNEKYSKLSLKQKQVLREYINNVTNSEKLKKYIVLETKKLQRDLLKTTTQIASKVVRIKITEVAKLLNNISKKHIIEDKDVLTILRYHELINEIKKTGKS